MAECTPSHFPLLSFLYDPLGACVALPAGYVYDCHQLLNKWAQSLGLQQMEQMDGSSLASVQDAEEAQLCHDVGAVVPQVCVWSHWIGIGFASGLHWVWIGFALDSHRMDRMFVGVTLDFHHQGERTMRVCQPSSG